MANKDFTVEFLNGAPSVQTAKVTVADGGSNGTAVVVTVGESLSLQDANARIRAFNRAWRRFFSKARSVASIPTGTSLE